MGSAPRKSQRVGLIAIIAFASLLATSVAYAATGDLTQKAGTAGCVSETGTGGACQDGEALDAAAGVAVSPDGTSAYVASIAGGALLTGGVAIFDRNTSTGALTQKAGTAGCISESGGAPCQDGEALGGAFAVAVSPDGASVYVASQTSDAIAIFDRNTFTGALTQKAGTAGCVSEDGTGSACQDGVALDSATGVAVSPDGASVYVASETSNAVAIFDRNTSTGALTQKAGTAGCVSEDGTASACQDGAALTGAIGLAVSPDASSVYVASSTSNAVAIFDRNTSTGALTQKAGMAGCVSELGGACQDGQALVGAFGVAVSPDGTSVYAASDTSDAVAIFDRNTLNGELTQKMGTAGCVSELGVVCQDGVALDGARGVAVSPDGSFVYVASTVSDAVATLDRNTSTGALTQRAGTAGCVSETGTGGSCQDGVALDGARSAAVSPNGASVYAVSDESDAVAIFDREPPPIPPTPAPEPEPGDTAPPDTQITKGPKDKTKKKTATFEFSANEPGVTFNCVLDGKQEFKACTSPLTVKVKKGKHTFQVQARDTAGNLDATPATDSWKVKKKRK